MVPKSERDLERSKSSSSTSGALGLWVVRLTEEVASAGFNLQIAPLAQDPLAAPELFRIVSTGLANVTVRLV